MRWKIETASLPAYVRVRTEGKLSFESFAAMWSDIFAHQSWQTGTCVLLDDRDLEPIGDEGFKLVTDAAHFFAGESGRIGDSRIAVLMDRRQDYKYMRQLQFSIRRRASSVNFQIFFDEADAARWLEFVCSDEHSEVQMSAA